MRSVISVNLSPLHGTYALSIASRTIWLPLLSGRVGELRGDPLAGVVVDDYPLGRWVAGPIGDMPRAEQVPLAVESHDPCPVVRWQVEPGSEFTLNFG